MLEEIKVATALRRLAILESQPLRNPQDLLEWDVLRKWVLKDPELLRQYREQEYFSQMEEVTKNQLAPKNPLPIFSRFFTKKYLHVYQEIYTQDYLEHCIITTTFYRNNECSFYSLPIRTILINKNIVYLFNLIFTTSMYIMELLCCIGYKIST